MGTLWGKSKLKTQKRVMLRRAALGNKRLVSTQVHPLAVVDPGAELGAGCRVGPFAVVGAGVRIGAGSVLHEHCVVKGDTHIGEGCEIFPYSVVGSAPQDRKHESQVVAKVRIGRQCVVREHATINGGSSTGGGVTEIGDASLILTGSHVGHDCRIGNGVVLSNLAQLAGHVHIGDFAVIGGAVALRQFVNVGRLAMIGGASAVDKHVLPYSMVMGNRAKLKGVNIVGLRRKQISYEQTKSIKLALEEISQARSKSSKDLQSVVASMATSAASPKHSRESTQLASVFEIYDFVLGNAGATVNCNGQHGALYPWDAPRRRLGLVL